MEFLVTDSDPHDPIGALNQVLSEVIDMVLDVKQANRKVPKSHPLYTELDSLFGDLRSWVAMLFDEDRELGVSPLGSIPSVAGRVPPNLWPGTASDEEVEHMVGEHLDRLADHVAAAIAEQEDETARALLVDVEVGVRAHKLALGELSA
jgi:hypothetical protein